MIYLDHAATSFPKPAPVLAAVRHWFEELGVSPQRGNSQICARVGARVQDVRHRIATMCGVSTHRVAFTSGATESLNLFLDGFLRPGDAVLTTAMEHSSVVRPLVHLAEARDLHIEVLPPDREGGIHPDQFTTALSKREFRLVAFSHGSNVLGSVLNAATICDTARNQGCTTLVDASQTAGLLDLDVGADAIVASAHKSLLAPPGLGFLAVREGIPVRMTRFGGTGSAVALDRQPEEWPTAMESGTPNTPAILALGAALDYIEERGRDSILAWELSLVDALRRELNSRAQVYGPANGPRIPVLSFTLSDLDPAEAGVILDSAGIHVRTGFHCAPWLHDLLGTSAAGTVRVSPGPFNSLADTLEVPRVLPGG